MNLNKLFLVTIVLMGLGLSSITAESVTSPFFSKSLSVSRIYSHQKGYKVLYRIDKALAHPIYIPIEWFSPNSPKTDDGFTKAEFVYGYGPAYPYMTLFWRDGKFHHLRLFVNANYNDYSWGVIKPGDDFSGKFDINAEPDLRF